GGGVGLRGPRGGGGPVGGVAGPADVPAAEQRLRQARRAAAVGTAVAVGDRIDQARVEGVPRVEVVVALVVVELAHGARVVGGRQRLVRAGGGGGAPAGRGLDG